MKLTNKIAEVLNKDLLFKILFTIFAGLVAFDACYGLSGNGWGTFYMISVLAFYGFAVFTLWSGLCGGKKTANILILIAVIYRLASFYFSGASMVFTDAEKTWAINVCTVFNFIAAICGIVMAAMFIVAVITKKELFKMIAIFGGIGLIGTKLLAYIFVFLRVVGVGNGVNYEGNPYFLNWTNLITAFIPLVAAALVIAVMSNIENRIEVK